MPGAVTPFVGVWIETTPVLARVSTQRSHPSWVCGLKLARRLFDNGESLSHPSWVCGLKRFVERDKMGRGGSHPSWVCGLKLFEGKTLIMWYKVTPFVGVWIETCCKYNMELCITSHPSWVCGLKQIKD